MRKIYKCRVCGFLVEGIDTPAICPACGVKGKIFEEHESPISKKRRNVLEMHIHSISVHFPIAFVVSLFLISLLMIIDAVNEQSVFMGMLKAIIMILPFIAVFAMIAGMVDGKLRFKRINTPHLKKKLVLAGIFVFLSFSLFIFQYFFPRLSLSIYKIMVLVHSIFLLSLAGILGFIGGKLLDSKVRG